MSRIELPTLVLTMAVYGTWLLLTRAAGDGSMTALVLLIPVLTLHASLQHEHIHGHPTASERLNTWLAGWPLGLWLPYAVYRRTHREHHASGALTDPRADAESFYVTADDFAGMSPIARAWRVALQTLPGRLVLGPATMIVATLRDEVTRWRRLDEESRRDERGALLAHGLGVVAVTTWLGVVCDLSPLLYFAAVVYPSLGLTLLRSFAEHRPDPDPARRTSVVESHLLGWLFLHNNLHVVHHDEPSLPWYALPRRWRAERPRYVSDGVTVHRGYGALLRFAFAPKDAPVHPGGTP